RASFERLYPNRFTQNQIGDIYSEARCGLFHNGMVNGKIIISNTFHNPIDIPDEETIKINPVLFLKDVKEDFRRYLKLLKSPNETIVRANFEQMFSNL